MLGKKALLVVGAFSLSSRFFAACGGDQGEEYTGAAITAGVAGGIEAVRLTRMQKRNMQSPPAPECCVYCDRCSFPCGDECFSIGAVCAEPQGCACWWDSKNGPESGDTSKCCISPLIEAD